MKNFLIALSLFPLTFFILPFTTSAQDCKLHRETDPFTKETKISTGFIFLEGASITIDADSKEIVVLFSVDNPDKCYDNNSTADLFFEGIKSKSQSRNGGTMNCEGLFQFVYKNSKSNPTTVLQRLLTKKLTHIIFTGNSGKPVTVNVGPKEQEAILFLGNCLLNEAKNLIK